MGSWIARNRMIAGGGLFALLLPLLSLLGRLDFAIAFAIAGAAGLGAYFLAGGNRPPLEIDEDRIDAGARETARQILSEALGDVERLAEAGRRIKAKDVREQVTHLVDLFRQTISQVTREPERLGSVRRLLTFYAPKAAEIADGYAEIESSPRPDSARLTRTAESLKKLDDAWAHFSDKLAEPDRTNLDIELDVLDQSLKSDMEKLTWR